MDTELIQKLFTSFEAIAQKVEGIDCWSARDLQTHLGYAEWRNFQTAIEKAKAACEGSGQPVKSHFVDVNKTVQTGLNVTKQIDDILLTRYACYLVAQNGDSRKEKIAFAQTYFAVQTRKQEIIHDRLAEIDRVKAREKLSETETVFNGIVFQREVDHKGVANIRSKGDQAFFGGFSTQAMKRRLKVPGSRPLADFLPTVSIKAKDLANELTNLNVIEKNLKGENAITNEHVDSNKAVRRALGDRNIRPEILPAAEDVKKVKRKLDGEGKKMLKQAKEEQNQLPEEKK